MNTLTVRQWQDMTLSEVQTIVLIQKTQCDFSLNLTFTFSSIEVLIDDHLSEIYGINVISHMLLQA